MDGMGTIAERPRTWSDDVKLAQVKLSLITSRLSAFGSAASHRELYKDNSTTMDTQNNTNSAHPSRLFVRVTSRL